MKVIDFIKTIRDLEYKLTFEFREENYFLKKEIVDNVYSIDLKLLDRKIKTANFIVLRNNKMPAILCEIGFLSNPSDASKLGKDEFQQKVAQSIYDSTLEVFEKYPSKR